MESQSSHGLYAKLIFRLGLFAYTDSIYLDSLHILTPYTDSILVTAPLFVWPIAIYKIQKS